MNRIESLCAFDKVNRLKVKAILVFFEFEEEILVFFFCGNNYIRLEGRKEGMKTRNACMQSSNAEFEFCGFEFSFL